MSSDLFLAQLIPQSFSTGSSFDSASSSATAKQLGSTGGNDDPAGGYGTFENTLSQVSDTDSTSNAPAPSDNGMADTREYVTGPNNTTADVSAKVPRSDNLLGVSHDNPTIGEDAVLDSNLAAALSSLTAILKELENVLMLANESGQESGPGMRQKISALSDILASHGNASTSGTVSAESKLQKLEALLQQFDSGGEGKLASEIRNLTELFARISTEDSQKLIKTPEVTKLVQNLTAQLQTDLGKVENQSQISRPQGQPQAGNPILNEKSAAADLFGASTTTTAPPDASPDKIAPEKRVSEQTLTAASSRTTGSGKITSGQIPVNQPGAPSTADSAEIKTSLAGLKEVTDSQLKQGLEGGVNRESSGPVLSANSSSAQSDTALQNAKVVNLKTDGSATEAAAGKLLNADSGNKEEGFSFSSQQQNEMKAIETQNIAKETETVQKEFRAQTLDQIVQKAALHLKNGQNEVQINLKPDFLGQIRMQIITDNQQVTVRILAEFPMVKELIESNAHQLRSELQNYGLDIDELEVSVSQNPDQYAADQNKADGSKNRQSSAGHQSGEDGDVENKAALSSRSDGLDDGVSTRIDFFA